MSKNQSLELVSLDNFHLISTSQLAKFLNYEQQTIRTWLCKDKLPAGLARPQKINGRNFWRPEDIRKFFSFDNQA